MRGECMETHPLEARRVVEFARAKVNLTLHVRGKRLDGYHELESLVMFADFGDELTISSAFEDDMRVLGPFAGAIDGDNLVFKAKTALAEWLKVSMTGRFVLTKNIPVAAGLGGGSSDAAAAIRGLLRLHSPDIDATAIPSNITAKVGADVPVCLFQKAAWMRGIGEHVTATASDCKLPILLVNPGVKLATRDVFNTLNADPYKSHSPTESMPIDWVCAETAVRRLSSGRNDLEAPAALLQPVIREVLQALNEMDDCLLSRLSGSGPTCFGIFRTLAAANRAQTELRTDQPNWWSVATTLS